MRVTNSMLVSNFMNNLNTNLGSLDNLQTQLAKNRKYAHMSDDPVSLIYSLQSRYKLERLERYQYDVSMGQSWLSQAETSIMDVNEVLKSAYESTIDLSTMVKNGEDRANAAEYVGQLRDHLLQTLNTTFGDKYVFGGYNTTGSYPGGEFEAPFTLNDQGDLLYNGLNLTQYDETDPAQKARYDELMGQNLSFFVGQELEMEVSFTGAELVGTGPDNVFSLLDQLFDTAKDPNATFDELSAFIPKLQDEQSRILGITAELGGRTQRLDMLESRYNLDNLNYTTMKSDAEDADQAELIMEYMMAQSVYKAALSTGSYVIQPTLMDYLR